MNGELMAADREMARERAHRAGRGAAGPGAARSLPSQQPQDDGLAAIPRWAAPQRPAGRVLHGESRRDMEARFGHDFSRVRIHDDPRANSSAAALGAAACTVGHDIILARPGPAPGDPQGRALIAHELAHVIQQERGGPAPQAGRDAPHERDAEAAARSAAAGTGPVRVGAATAVGAACAPAGPLEVAATAGAGALERVGPWDQDGNFVDEIPIDPVRIPVIDDIGDALRQAGYAAAGLANAWLEDNWRAFGLPPHHEPLAALLGIPADAAAYRLGRGARRAVALLQAAAEMVGGAGLIVTGGGEFLAGIAATPAGGAGLVVMPVAVVTVGAGLTVVVHGGALGGAVFMSAVPGRSDDGGGGGGGRRQQDGLRQVTDVAREFTMTEEQRRDFGEFLESEEAGGNGGAANERGDFTCQELRTKAAEFLELYGQ